MNSLFLRGLTGIVTGISVMISPEISVAEKGAKDMRTPSSERCRSQVWHGTRIPSQARILD